MTIAVLQIDKTSAQKHSTPCPKKIHKQNYFCHNFVKFSQTLIILA